MSPSDTLLAARDLISDPRHWCRNDFNNFTHSRHCAAGALFHIRNGCERPYNTIQNSDKSGEYLLKAGKAYVKEHSIDPSLIHSNLDPSLIHPIPYINDYLGHKAVMEIYDRAIRLAKDAGE